MNVFLDTNVLLDVLAARAPHHVAAATVWSWADTRAIAGFVSAISFNNIYYVLRKFDGRDHAREAMRLLRNSFAIVAADAQIISQAIDSDIPDFEDAIQFCSAQRAAAEYLLTRGPDDFPKSNMIVMSPEEFVKAREK